MMRADTDEFNPDRKPSDHFWIAPFALDGELLGMGEQSFQSLSRHWLDVCTSLIKHYGSVFDQPLQGPLSHLRIRCTVADGVAMVVLYAHELPATSFAVATGVAPAAEESALSMFATSIRSSTLPYHVSGREMPFSEITCLAQRPLMIVIPWAQSPIAEQDRELVKELSWHLAAALIHHLDQ